MLIPDAHGAIRSFLSTRLPFMANKDSASRMTERRTGAFDVAHEFRIAVIESSR